jgi:hypothetical protein
MKRILRRYLGLTTDCWMLGAEASLVVPLRLARLARGGAAAKVEARLMVSEKVEAHGALLRDLGQGRLGRNPVAISAGAVRHYLVRVRANRKRLMGEA